jgi:hypothetical protein
MLRLPCCLVSSLALAGLAACDARTPAATTPPAPSAPTAAAAPVRWADDDQRGQLISLLRHLMRVTPADCASLGMLEAPVPAERHSAVLFHCVPGEVAAGFPIASVAMRATALGERHVEVQLEPGLCIAGDAASDGAESDEDLPGMPPVDGGDVNWRMTARNTALRASIMASGPRTGEQQCWNRFVVWREDAAP